MNTGHRSYCERELSVEMYALTELPGTQSLIQGSMSQRELLAARGEVER